MKKITRAALILAGAIGLLLATALLAVNLYVQSRGTQARIEQELSERLGATLHIRRISVTPWFGLKLTGIKMPQADEAAPGDFLRADTFRLRIRLTSLFARRLVITEISLINPDVVWAQNTDGKWRLPASFAEDAAAAAEAPATTAAAAKGAAPTGPAAPAAVGPSADQAGPTADAEAAEPTTFTPEVRRVNLTNGNFRFLD
ncbi:MAG TPA: AsmA family protein, partial [Chthoniobacterales bacterium]|nr:AsmA family protein [Chthoniobacterales bacterium]